MAKKKIEETKKNPKEIIFTVILSLLIVFLFGATYLEKINKKVELPLPKEGGELQVDVNINVENIDDYLNLDNAVYRDMRMLVDEADYENIGGDSYLSGYVKGFEIVPYPYLVNVTGLPDAVGKPYSGKTLFTVDEDGKYTANYKESLAILEYLFPKDKTIFLMCGGGGYAGMTKSMLVSLGWDKDKIYNTGGYWSYNGENKVILKEDENFEYWKAPYHYIDFSLLSEVK